MTRGEFRPGSVEIHDNALPVLRGHAVRLGVERRLLYGFAMESAAHNEDAFLTYARAEVTGSTDETAGRSADSTQQLTDKHD